MTIIQTDTDARDNDVRGHGEGVRHIRHPVLGPIAFEYSVFAVDGRPELSMVVYNPATPASELDTQQRRAATAVLLIEGFAQRMWTNDQWTVVWRTAAEPE